MGNLLPPSLSPILRSPPTVLKFISATSRTAATGTSVYTPASAKVLHRSTRHLSRQSSAPATYYRGGTSRALVFHRNSLPHDVAEWPSIFRTTLGSPDPHGRQLDGMGGGISSLSKICVVSKSEHKDADVDFTFAAVGIKDGEVDMSANCGNMLSAIGPYAIENRIIEISRVLDSSDSDNGPAGTTTGELVQRLATVRILNTNTAKIIHSTFPVLVSPTGEFVEVQTYGDFAIDGVAGTAARVKLSFRDPAGSKTGKLLPTGGVVDTFHGKEATCIDASNPAIFVRAKDFGVDGTITPDQATEQPSLLAELERVRRSAAVKMGVGKTEATVPVSIPKICLVAPAATNWLSSGVEQKTGEVDVLIRAISVGQPHKAIPITMALAAAAAAKLQGSIVNECLSAAKADPDGVTIGHASGKIVVGSTFDTEGKLEAATVYRTARKLMEGQVYWR